MKCTSLLYGSLLAAALLVSSANVSRASLMSACALGNAADAAELDIQVARRGGGVAVSRGGAAVRRSTVVGPGGGVAVRKSTVVRTGRWVRPAHYRWRAGGAIAAGAAIGFVTAATAAAWAGAAPCPNCCWYYTDPSRTQGFWDQCP